MADKIGGIILLGAVSLFFIVINGRIFWNNMIAKKKWISEAPLIGGLLGGITILLIVGRKYWFLALIPMVLDWGCIPLIVRFILTILSEFITPPKK